ncbi:MAG: EF-hand domain-containing protein [Gammaproteobacteria bacterium]|nr:EF-hand domain-containing protein [Gammaproteobacteria bacterium]
MGFLPIRVFLAGSAVFAGVLVSVPGMAAPPPEVVVDRLDRDGDGRISPEEWQTPWKVFRDDGSITSAGQPKSPQVFRQMDANGDGYVVAEEIRAFRQGSAGRSNGGPGAAGGNPPPPETVVERMDADRDGRISRDEWRKPPQAFQRIDADHDGFVTADEIRRFREQQARQSSPFPDRIR